MSTECGTSIGFPLTFMVILVFFAIMMTSEKEKTSQRLDAVAADTSASATYVEIESHPTHPDTYQTFLFTVQVVTHDRQSASSAKSQMAAFCKAIKIVPEIEEAVPVKLYGVYKDAGKTMCEQLFPDPTAEEK